MERGCLVTMSQSHPYLRKFCTAPMSSIAHGDSMAESEPARKQYASFLSSVNQCQVNNINTI
jgi:hypothetical protein